MVSEHHDSPMASDSTPSPSAAMASSAAPISSSIVNPGSSKFDPHLVSIKLGEDNYLVWKQQALATIRGYKLQKFLLGSHAIPEKFASAADEARGQFREEFLTWEQQDQLLLSWLLASMSESMLTRMVGCEFSYQIWDKLESFFSSQTKAKVLQLKTQLRNLKKGSVSVNEYLLKLKKIIDSLFSVGASVSESDHIESILEGLPEEYNSFIVSVTSRSDSYSVNQIESLLLAQEERLDKYKKESTPALSANLAQSSAASKNAKSPVGSSPNQSKVFGNSQSQQGRFTNFRGSNRGGRGRGGRGYNGSGSRPQCQVCGKVGHMAWQCYHRFDDQFISPFTQFNQNASSQRSPRPAQPSAMHAMISSSHNPFEASWYPDTGATNHITPHAHNLGDGSEYTGSDHIHLADGTGMPISSVGRASVQHSIGFPSLYLNHLLHVPLSTKNLMSVSQFAADNNVYFEFYPHYCCVKSQDTKRTLLQGTVKDGLYMFDHLPISPSTTSSAAVSLKSALSAQSSVKHSSATIFDLWHCRLGHSSHAVVNTVLKECNLPTYNNTQYFCSACCLGKAHKLPFSPSQTVCNAPLELIHSDVWGPAPLISSNGFQYYVHFTDHYSRFTWLYLLKHKSDVYKAFTDFKQLVENQFDHKIKILQTDGGGEFIALKSFLQTHGIQHRLSCPYTPEQNGLAERKHRHITEMGRTLLAKSSLPFKFWDDAFCTAVYLINRLPSSVLQYRTPYELIFHKPPAYSFLKTFGCACFPNIRPYNSNKLQFKSEQCTFVGYSNQYKGYKCLSSTGKVYFSRDVLFDEHTFPFAHSQPVSTSVTVTPSSVSTSLPSIPLISSPPMTAAPVLPTTDICTSNAFLPENVVLQNPVHSGSSSQLPSTVTPSSSTSTTSSTTRYLIPSSSSNDQSSSTRYMLPTHTPPSPTPSITQPLPNPPAPPHTIQTRSKSGIYKPKAYSAVSLPSEPTSVAAALKHPQWKAAMQAEYDALLKNQTWSLVSLPPGRKPIGCKWVFKLKQNADGSLNRYKARLVAKGFHQKPGFDFGETFSPVVKPVTVRVVLTVALSNHWPIKQLDINNAFLNGTLSEEVYMSQPPGFVSHSSDLVCKLHKSLYGLRQAPRAWFTKLASTLLKFGFINARSDTSLFVRKTTTSIIYILVYVDDIIITGSSTLEVSQLTSSLHKEFALKDLGDLNYFLGIQVTKTASGGLLLSQTKYVTDLLQKVNMTIANPQPTPMVSTAKFTLDGTSVFSDPHLYRATVGALQYVCVTRPDLAYSVNKLSQFMHNPLDDHWQGVKRILRYLAGTKTMGLQLLPTSHPRLTALCDADWGSDPVDRRSTSGFCIYFGPNLISWVSKKQPIVSRSSTEAEYRALALTVAELTWLKSLMTELCLPKSSSPPIVYCDNSSTVLLSANPVMHSRTKHIELDLYFVREKVQNKEVSVCHISAKDQIADALTKPLPKSQFLLSRHKLKIRDLPSV